MSVRTPRRLASSLLLLPAFLILPVVAQAQATPMPQVYDPATGTWEDQEPAETSDPAEAPDPTGTSDPVETPDTALHVEEEEAGGHVDSPARREARGIRAHAVYDPATDRWSAAPSISLPPGEGVDATFGLGALPVSIGGECRPTGSSSTPQVEVWDAEEEAWISLSPRPRDAQDAQSTAEDGRVDLIGGQTECGASGSELDPGPPRR